MMIETADGRAPCFPVSVKGVVFIGGRVVLLRNERDEWELPGGKLDPGEEPTSCVVREIEEELGLAVAVDTILDSWVYDIQGKVKVLIVTYLCGLRHDAEPRLSHEHKELGLFLPGDIGSLPMPEGYRRSVRHAMALVEGLGVGAA